MEDLAPKIQDAIVDLRGAMKRAEGNEAVSKGRQRRDIGRISQRRQAAKSARKAHQFFAVTLWFSWRIQNVIGKPIINCIEACRVQVSQPGHLNGCGLEREGQQSVARGVPGQIDKNVDTVLANAL